MVPCKASYCGVGPVKKYPDLNTVVFPLLHQELEDLQDKYKHQGKELRDAMQQRKLAVDEFADINEKSVSFLWASYWQNKIYCGNILDIGM